MTTPEKLLELEQGVVNRSVGQWVKDVAEVKKAILILISEADSRDLSGLVPQITALIDSLNVPKDMAEEALAGVLQAHDFGKGVVTNAVDGKLPKVAVSKNSKAAVADIRKDALSVLDIVKKNLAAGLIGGGAQSILTAVAPVLQNPAKAEAAVTWAINNASNSAVSKLSLEMGETMTWIGERNGCVHCQAYNGQQSTKTGFPKDLTFAAKPLKLQTGTLPHPPLHPNCRCTVEPGLTQDYADALKREAVRSILKGVKEDSESDKVRIEAAKRLLAEDPVAPASVKKYANRMVKDFETKQKEKADKPTPKAKQPAKKVVTTTPKPKAPAKAPKEPEVKASDIELKSAQKMSNAEKLKAAELMYGKNSLKYQQAVKRFGKK